MLPTLCDYLSASLCKTEMMIVWQPEGLYQFIESEVGSVVRISLPPQADCNLPGFRSVGPPGKNSGVGAFPSRDLLSCGSLVSTCRQTLLTPEPPGKPCQFLCKGFGIILKQKAPLNMFYACHRLLDADICKLKKKNNQHLLRARGFSNRGRDSGKLLFILIYLWIFVPCVFIKAMAQVGASSGGGRRSVILC